MNRILLSFAFLFAAALNAQVTLQVSPSSLVFSALAGSPAQTQTISVASSGDSAGQHITYTATVQNVSSGSTLWLSLSNASATTPAQISVSAIPGSLPQGVYTAQILITAAGTVGNSPQLVPVTFTVSQIAAAPASLSFSYQIGSSAPSSQTVAISGPTPPVSFSAAAATSTGGDWLEVAPTSGSSGTNITVSLNPAVVGGLAAGVYQGAVTVQAVGNSTAVTIPVTLNVSTTPQLTIAPASFSFGYQIGGTNNVIQQNLSVTSSGAAVTFSVLATTSPNSSGASWLVVSNPGPDVTPVTLTVGISAASLPAGTYTGQISIVASGATVATLPVTLTVSTTPLLTVSPTVLNFAFQTGGAAPPSQTVNITSTSSVLNYSVFPTTTSGGNWLQVLSGNSTPNPFTVSVNPAGLGAGVYSGSLMVSANGAANSPIEIPVTLTVTAFPLVQASPSPLTFVYQIGQSAPPNQVLNVTSSTGDQLNFSSTGTTTSGGNWLQASLLNGTAPGTVNVGVTTAGLAPGTYSGSVNITATNPAGVAVPNSPLSVPVTYYVSNDPLLAVSPGSLTFTAAAGATTAGQMVTITSTSASLGYTVSSATQSSGPWLLVSAAPGGTPGSIQVYATASALSPGTYTGSVTITATNSSGAAVADSPLVIPVTFQVVAGTLTASPSALTFSQVLGGSTPATQTIKLSTGAEALNYTAVASNNSGVNWLTVTPTSGATPATLTVSVDGSKLSPGTYVGLITVTAANAAGSPLTVQVTLTVTGPPNISVTPATLQFAAQIGGAAPATQSIAVASNGANVAFTAAAAVTNGSSTWLSVTPTSGNTPGTLTVSANPAGLAAGSYTGTVTITAAGAGNSPQTVNVTLTVSVPSTPLPTSVVNAASQVPGPVAPGEIISIYGTNLGPATGTGPVISGSTLANLVSGVQVMFDNNPAPLLYVSATQINAVVPFEINGQTQTHMVVNYYGSPSASTGLVVSPAIPGLFTITENGTGQIAAVNLAGGTNSASNPVAAGGVIELYATGGGETTPQGATGNITPNDGTGLKTIAGVSVTVGDLPCTVIYAGSAPGFIEGALQINVQLPDNVPSGAQPVVVKIDSNSSPATTTLAVK